MTEIGVTVECIVLSLHVMAAPIFIIIFLTDYSWPFQYGIDIDVWFSGQLGIYLLVNLCINYAYRPQLAASVVPKQCVLISHTEPIGFPQWDRNIRLCFILMEDNGNKIRAWWSSKNGSWCYPTNTLRRFSSPHVLMIFFFMFSQAEPLSYIGPGEIIGIGVLAFVIIFLLILFVAFRKKIKFRKESDPGLGTQPVVGVSAISTEASYMLHKTGMGTEGIEFKAVRVSGSPAMTSTYSEVGGSTGGPPQVMVRPTAHSPLPGGLINPGMRNGDGDKTTSSEGSQVHKTKGWMETLFMIILILFCVSRVRTRPPGRAGRLCHGGFWYTQKIIRWSCAILTNQKFYQRFHNIFNLENWMK